MVFALGDDRPTLGFAEIAKLAELIRRVLALVTSRNSTLEGGFHGASQAFSTCASLNKFAVRVPAVYLKPAEGTILAFLAFYEINNLSAISGTDGFEPRPAHHHSTGLSRPDIFRSSADHGV